MKFETRRDIESVDLTASFLDLLARHPDQEVRDALQKGITNGNIKLTWEEDAMWPSSFTYELHENKEVTFTLNINPRCYRSLDFPDAKWFLVLVHEHVHLQQGPVPSYITFTEAPMTVAQICHSYENEVAAFVRESEFALRHGWSELYEECLVFAHGGEQALRRFMAETFLSSWSAWLDEAGKSFLKTAAQEQHL